MTYNPDEIDATLQQLKQEVRSRRLGGELSQSSEVATALARVRLTSWVNPHQPIAWPHWPSGLGAKVKAVIQKVVRRLLRWYISPLVNEQNRFNEAVDNALGVLAQENVRLRAELRMLSARYSKLHTSSGDIDQTEVSGEEFANAESKKLSQDEIQKRIATRPFWWHRIEVAPGIVTPGHKDTLAELKQRIGLPERLDGNTVLDIGAAEGFYSFECERRGAQVTAVDLRNAEDSGFGLVRELIGSRAKHIQCSVYKLDPNQIGQFDLVLFLGVIYHLRYPLLALDILHSICKDTMIIESQICDRCFIKEDGSVTSLEELLPELIDSPLAQFYPENELNDDITNWWAPNQLGLIKMLETSGFKSQVYFSDGVRAVLHCKKVDRSTLAAQQAAIEVESIKGSFFERGH